MKTILNQSVDRRSMLAGNASIVPLALPGFAGRQALTLLLLGILACLAPRAAVASDPIGVYALVEKVVLEPGDTAPERIQVWGAFAVAHKSGYEYKKAEPGYLYYKLDPARASQCQKEWSDLKSVAGTGQIVSFGSRYSENGKVRAKEAKLENADLYPPGIGVVKLKDRDYGPINDLVKFRKVAKKESSPPAAK